MKLDLGLGQNVSQLQPEHPPEHDPLTCPCCREAEGGLAAGRRAALTVKALTQELLTVEAAICDDDHLTPGDAAEHIAWKYRESCESEESLLEQLRAALRGQRADCPSCDGDGSHERLGGLECADCAGYGTLDAAALATMVRELTAALEEQGQTLRDQQAVHEAEMEDDGRARAVMVALCRDLGVSIYTDASRGIRDEMHRRRAP